MLKRLMTIQSPAALVSCCVVLMLALPSKADSLQREGFPLIDGVTLIGVKDGKVQYRTAAGDREVALADLVSLSIDSVPEFKAGLDAMNKAEFRAAQRSFKSVWDGSRVEWIRHVAGFYLVQVYDKRGEPVDAAEIYAKLASENADLHFLSKAPVASLAEADENQKKRIGEQITAVVRSAKGERRTLLRTYHQQVIGKGGTLPEIDDPAGKQAAAANDTKAKSKVFMPQSVWNLLEKKERAKGEWDAIRLLAKGDAKESLEAIEPWLNSPGDLPEKLFIRGLAELMLADQGEDKELYQDAGLTFMRIVVHFDRNGTAHPLVAAAKLEVAYIHKQIGREDIHDRLLEQVHLTIDEAKDYPEYRKRYYQIIKEEIPKEENQP